MAELRTLWVGEVEPHWDDAYLGTIFSGATATKIVRDSGAQIYGFVEFPTGEAAGQVLSGYNGHPIAGTNKVYSLNWAQHNIGEGKSAAVAPGHHAADLGVTFDICGGSVS